MDKEDKKQTNNTQYYTPTAFSPNNANQYKILTKREPTQSVRPNPRHTSGFTILGFIFSALFLIDFLLMLIFHFSAFTIITSVISSTISIACLFGLGTARSRVQELEDDLTVAESDIKRLNSRVKKIHKRLTTIEFKNGDKNQSGE